MVALMLERIVEEFERMKDFEKAFTFSERLLGMKQNH